METPAERLRYARLEMFRQTKDAVYKSARSAAFALGVPESTYRAHETGTRGFDEDDARKYGRRYKVEPLWIIHGDAIMNGRRAPMIKVINRVGAGAQIFAIDDLPQGEGFEEIPAPPGVTEGIGLRVSGESMWPKYEDGDIIVCEARELDPESLIGRYCYVKLTDGRVYLKKLKSGSKPGLYTLSSHNWPDIPDVQLEKAYPVAWSKPG